ncbi:hypothetical protein X777_11958 [Ooceraea biroi]|uniref:Uncharacterized protein n=1 Tax=Ooceraea biroi TaxID=2015173 RepID=A0A026W0H3_OOCBI|nr:hypothetical protein X777_11958 [Ooceraea biroi]
MWFQHDGVPPHFVRIVKDFLNIRYAHRWIGRGGYVAWPPRSPDLTPIDFFLWGCIKNIVFLNPPTTRDDMKRRIRNACRSISRTLFSIIAKSGR